jgi:hypothetical protein
MLAVELVKGMTGVQLDNFAALGMPNESLLPMGLHISEIASIVRPRGPIFSSSRRDRVKHTKLKGLFLSSPPGSKYSRLAATTIAAQAGSSRLFEGTYERVAKPFPRCIVT